MAPPTVGGKTGPSPSLYPIAKTPSFPMPPPPCPPSNLPRPYHHLSDPQCSSVSGLSLSQGSCRPSVLCKPRLLTNDDALGISPLKKRSQRTQKFCQRPGRSGHFSSIQLRATPPLGFLWAVATARECCKVVTKKRPRRHLLPGEIFAREPPSGRRRRRPGDSILQ